MEGTKDNHCFPSSSVDKESACNLGDLGSVSGLGRFPGEGKGYPLQYSGLENSMDCIVHGGHKESDTTERLSLQMALRTRKGLNQRLKQTQGISLLSVESGQILQL